MERGPRRFGKFLSSICLSLSRGMGSRRLLDLSTGKWIQGAQRELANLRGGKMWLGGRSDSLDVTPTKTFVDR